MLASEIMRKEVLDTNAVKVGNIADVEINLGQGTISHYVLRTGTFKKAAVTPDRIDKIGDKVILKISKVELEKSPAGVR